MSVPLGSEPTNIHHKTLPLQFFQLCLESFFFLSLRLPLPAPVSERKEKSACLSSSNSIPHTVTKKTSVFWEYTNLASFIWYFNLSCSPLPDPGSIFLSNYIHPMARYHPKSPHSRSLCVSMNVPTPSEVCALRVTPSRHQSEIVLHSLLQSVARDCEAQYRQKKRWTCCRSCGRCTATTVARRQIQPCYDFFGYKSAIAQTQVHT